MKIRLINSGNKYTMISKEWLQDNRLSFRARGLMAYLLSLKADDADLSEHLLELSRHDPAVDGAVNELKEHGYLT